jgi:glycosyltransferase involved in cell wall biosynthesis
VAVVVPAYHVAATIRDVVVRIRRAVPDANVYVVDDGSTDGTGAAAREQGAVVLVHRHNHGKGAALRTGIERALADGARVIVTIDGDGQHPPEEIPRLVAPVRGGEADLVLGARSRSGTMPLGRRCTNWLSAALASRVGGVRVPDAQTGFRAIARSPAEAIRPAEHGYDFETAFLLAALAQGVRVRSVRVPTLYQGQESHFRGWADTWRQVRVFTRYGRQIIFGAR